MLGFYHKVKGAMASESEVKEECHREASFHYRAAAACLPEDDEKHCCMLSHNFNVRANLTYRDALVCA